MRYPERRAIYEHDRFHLSAGQTLREDITLQVGQSTESVEVSADASLLQTESSQLVHNVTLSQLDNLPLLPVGATNDGLRDYFGASRLLPGIQYQNSGSFSAVVQAVVNGTPNNSLQTRLDGATMNPTSLRLLGATMETQPSPEALQDVQRTGRTRCADRGQVTFHSPGDLANSADGSTIVSVKSSKLRRGSAASSCPPTAISDRLPEEVDFTRP